MADLKNKPGCLGFLLKLFGNERAAVTEAWPYRRRQYLLSKAEFSFYRVLQHAGGGRWVICPKVGLGDLLYIQKGTANFTTWRNRIDRKHVDFVLCDARTLQPLVVVELDDASHRGERAMQRDADKDRALRAADLPLLRVPAKKSYDPRALAAELDRVLQSSNDPVS